LSGHRQPLIGVLFAAAPGGRPIPLLFPCYALQFLCKAAKIPLFSEAAEIAFNPLIQNGFSRAIKALFGCLGAFSPVFSGIPQSRTLSPTPASRSVA
jgi:hypothetical protein